MMRYRPISVGRTGKGALTIGIGPTADPAVLENLRRQVLLQPGDLIARHNLAVELRKAGDPLAALEQIEQARVRGLDAPETHFMHGNILGDLGRFEEAVEAYRVSLARNPRFLDGHVVLASLLPQLGRPEAALDSFRSALDNAGDYGPLWVQALATAKANGEFAQLLEWSEAAEARWGTDTLISTYRAIALSGLGRDGEALQVLEVARAADPGDVSVEASRAHVLMRLGEYERAAEAALFAVQRAPQLQSAWALLGTSWRLLGDPREDWLCDYDRLVMQVEVDPPGDLQSVLERRHILNAAPPDQSVRGGTQTHGNLFETPDPVILATARALQEGIENALRELPADAQHPFLSRNTRRVDFPTSWSVRLSHSGRHISHIHPQGWMSSVYYVELPQSVGKGEPEGALTFGVPDAALGLDLPPRRTVQPKVGKLVLFPSYFWHGTNAFQDEGVRMTIAFDMVPTATDGR